jgi:hypothetical protein
VTTNNFSLLMDELAAADQARQRAPMRKAQDGDWVREWVQGRREPDAAAPSLQTILRRFDSLGRESEAIAKAMPAPLTPSPREIFARAYQHFTKLVAEGRLSGLDACRVESRFHHIAERL